MTDFQKHFKNKHLRKNSDLLKTENGTLSFD